MSGESTGRLPTSPVMQSERAFCDTRYKRLEAGTFELPTAASHEQGIELDASQLTHLLGGIDLRTGADGSGIGAPINLFDRRILSTIRLP